MRVDDNRSNIDRMSKTIDEISSYRIEVGIFGDDDSFIQMIAGVHEFGLTITPKKSSYLTVPLSPKYVGKSARSVDGLFFYTAKSGNKFLVRTDDKGGLEFAYMLMEEVKVPERSFIRSTFDEKEQEWSEFFVVLVTEAIFNGTEAKLVLDKMGAKIASDIQNKMTELKDPPKKNSTLAAAPGKTNPLIKTGRLRQSVTWKVVSK